VKPKLGAAAFFSYKGPDGRMDDGYTEHSGCPVLEGEKWISVAWLREGVSWNDTADDYDPEGIRILEEGEQFEEDSEVGERQEVDVGLSG
jgi:hypothetical protein